MLLHTLLRLFDPNLPLDRIPDLDIGGVCEDSRRVQRGDLFIARSGTRTDGRQFIADAAARGAVAVVVERRLEDCPLPHIVVPDAARAVSVLANIFHGQPSHALAVLGVTGTNGKTTTAYLVRHLLASAARRCGMIGTVQIDDGVQSCEAEMTTPGAVDIARLLATMRQSGCAACAMEVSSHALDQHRVSGVRFAAAAFTNLSGDHLDYHKTMENYAAAKARLFAALEPSAVAVVNAHDPASQRMLRDSRARTVRFAIDEPADYRAADVEVTADGSRFTIHMPQGSAPVRMRFIGRHNILNALAAAALVAETFGLTAEHIAQALAEAVSAPGRLQPVRCGQPFAVFVDYAHTDDGLENVLKALRPLTRQKLRVVFGCGGDRDRGKRPRMAAVAERLADVLYLTSDNPRTEDPHRILDEIVAGLSADVELAGAARPLGAASRTDRPRKCAFVEPDRRRAIERALMDATEGDVVLLAGKGHENYQIIGTQKHHFDDVEEATRVLLAGRTVAA
jgi:UDP-N-acetylmuramoyl-L-alanyl-D-glutamate--2,6-diaminopimelate ligase